MKVEGKERWENEKAWQKEKKRKEKKRKEKSIECIECIVYRVFESEGGNKSERVSVCQSKSPWPWTHTDTLIYLPSQRKNRHDLLHNGCPLRCGHSVLPFLQLPPSLLPPNMSERVRSISQHPTIRAKCCGDLLILPCSLVFPWHLIPCSLGHTSANTSAIELIELLLLNAIRRRVLSSDEVSRLFPIRSLPPFAHTPRTSVS